MRSDQFLAAVEAYCPHGWQVELAPTSGERWVVARRREPPPQGWKLHVSATPATAGEVLRCSLDVLCDEDAAFKVAATPGALARINAGSYGLSQIGKFVTVYPNDEAQAVRLAHRLDDATRGLAGPAVPSDQVLAPGSLVHYRYGGFDGRQIRTPLGEVVAAMSGPGGELVPDRRFRKYRAPEWVADPFGPSAGDRSAGGVRVVAGRYLIVAALASSARGGVYLSVDRVVGQTRVLKQSCRHALAGTDGPDGRTRLRREFGLLESLVAEHGVPTVLELVEDGDELFLVMEHVAGETLESEVGNLARRGRLASSEDVRKLGRALAGTLAAVHRRGWVHRDLSPANIVLGDGRGPVLVDFDLAHRTDDRRLTEVSGTPGFWSPQQRMGGGPVVTDDIYGLGAVLYFAATGTGPAFNDGRVFDRPPSLLNPTIDPCIEAVISRCLDPDPSRRFGSMDALAAHLDGHRAKAPALGCRQPPAQSPSCPGREYRELAGRLGDTMCKDLAAATAPGTGSRQDDDRIDDLTGIGGAVLALAEVVSTCGGPRRAAALRDAAHGLTGRVGPAPCLLPGLYVGKAGVGAAQLRAGQVLRDADVIAAASGREREVASAPYGSPDVMNGTAGRLRFHLLMFDETGDPESLARAVSAGRSLLSVAESRGDGALCWTIPPGYDALSGTAGLGYAHGAAGIADSLLDLFEVTFDERFLAGARGAARWLVRQVVPVLSDGRGAGWPSQEGSGVWPAFWCHGATGIGRFLLRAGDLGDLPMATEVAERAALAAGEGTTWAGPSQCHGLAGNIELLLDVYQATNDVSYLEHARHLADVLITFAVERDGHLSWARESPLVGSTDYLVGYPGVAVCLLRLADPEHRPHQLSIRGFREGRLRPVDLAVTGTFRSD